MSKLEKRIKRLEQARHTCLVGPNRELLDALEEFDRVMSRLTPQEQAEANLKAAAELVEEYRER